MPVTPFTASLIADAFIAANDLQPTAKADIVLIAPKLGENAEANKAVLDEWLSTRAHVRKSVEQKHDETIDLNLERAAFGAAASPSGRAKLYRTYGPDLFNQRRLAWGASEGTIRSGTEPGAEGRDKATVEQAAKIIADQDSNSPFNPAKRFLTEETRANECAKFVVRFGTKATRAQCVKFNCDIAGRPLRKRA